MTPSQRRALLIASIIAWIVLTSVHFASVQMNARRHGAPLDDVEARVASRMVLAMHAAGISETSATVFHYLDLDLLLQQRLTRVPTERAGSVRCRFAVMLHSVGRVQEAERLLHAVPAGDAAARLAAALADALAARSLGPGAAARDARAIGAGLDGWLRTYAMERLHRNAGMVREARADAADFRLEATAAGHGLLVLGGVLTLEFVLGVAALVVFLTVGKDWNLRATPPEVEPSWDPVLGWCVVVAWPVLSLALGLLLHRSLGAETRSPLVLLGLQVVLYGMVLALVHELARGRWMEVGLHDRRLGASVLLGAAGTSVAFILVLVVALLIARLSGPTGPSSNPVFEVLRKLRGPGDYLAMMGLVAVLGPFFEEILFRGVVYQSLKQAVPVWAAVPLSAAVFSLAHGDLNGALPLFVLGCLLAYEFERTRSLAASFATHCLWNAQVFLATIYLFS